MSRSLPQHPSLKHLRNEAKALHRSHKLGEPATCRVLRLLHRFSVASEEEVFAAEIPLSEVQYALAMDYGFDSWAKLKTYVEDQMARNGASRGDKVSTFGEREAWSAIHAAVEKVDMLPSHDREQILSITVAGSLVRGDFVANRSAADIFTVYIPDVEHPWDTDLHGRVRSCFDEGFEPYGGLSSNPNLWEDLCVAGNTLPKAPQEIGNHRLKQFGIYCFDLVKHHRTVWGEDFTKSMPAPPDPKAMVFQRLNWILDRSLEHGNLKQGEWSPLPVLVVEAMRALQLYFSEEPSIHKSETLRRYENYVPEFPEKSFALDVWWEYLDGKPFLSDGTATSLRSYVDYIEAALRVVNAAASG